MVVYSLEVVDDGSEEVLVAFAYYDDDDGVMVELVDDVVRMDVVTNLRLQEAVDQSRSEGIDDGVVVVVPSDA